MLFQNIVAAYWLMCTICVRVCNVCRYMKSPVTVDLVGNKSIVPDSVEHQVSE